MHVPQRITFAKEESFDGEFCILEDPLITLAYSSMYEVGIIDKSAPKIIKLAVLNKLK